MADYDQSLRLDPDNAFAYNNRGGAYDDLGQYPRAIEDYDQAIRLDADYADAYNNRGNTYDKLGQREKAVQDWQKACELGLQQACDTLKQED